jgi:hypothetical protein
MADALGASEAAPDIHYVVAGAAGGFIDEDDAVHWVSLFYSGRIKKETDTLGRRSNRKSVRFSFDEEASDLFEALPRDCCRFAGVAAD